MKRGWTSEGVSSEQPSSEHQGDREEFGLPASAQASRSGCPLMGRQAAYRPCPKRSEEEDMNGHKMGARCEQCKNFALLSTTVFTLTFLGLFVWQLYSKPASQLGEESQAQLQNQTSQVQAQLEKCTEALEKDRDKAQKDHDDLRAQLAIATQSLSNNSQRWNSCQKELHNLQGNITSQNKEIAKEQAEKHKLQEEIKQLRQQISDWENQKKQEPPESSGTIICGLGITLLLPLLALLLV